MIAVDMMHFAGSFALALLERSDVAGPGESSRPVFMASFTVRFDQRLEAPRRLRTWSASQSRPPVLVRVHASAKYQTRSTALVLNTQVRSFQHYLIRDHWLVAARRSGGGKSAMSAVLRPSP